MKRCARLVLLCLLSCLCLAVGLAEENTPLLYREQAERWASLPAATETIVIEASAHAGAEMENLEVLPDGTLYTGEAGYVEYEITVPEDALYAIRIRYFPGAGHGGDIQRSVMINSALPFDEAKELVFSRMWNDKDRNYKNAAGNHPIPSQVETPEWREVYLTDPMGYTVAPFTFALKKGVNILRIDSITEDMIIDTITLCTPQSLPTYAEYFAALTAEGVAPAKVDAIKLQAEDAALKSSPSFYPMNDRTSPLSEPYHPTYITLNSIGASAWYAPGQWIAWDINIPTDGLYRIAFRYKQSEVRGMYAGRSLSINGEVPFLEAADLRFYFSTEFQFEALGKNRDNPLKPNKERQEYWVYLHEGINRIELCVALGELGDILLDMEEVLLSLNGLYREIVAITGSAPDQYRDYQLFKRVPHLTTTLTAQREQLQSLFDRLTLLTGTGSQRTAGIARLIVIIDDLLKGDSGTVVKRLASFKECVTAIGESALTLKEQPLRIDYIIVAGEEMPKVQADGNFFQKLQHTLASFAGSFYNDYTVIDSSIQEEKQSISVWLSSGRDQFDMIRRLINENFETDTGIQVNLKLITADALLPSTFTGIGPDVAIQIGNSAPVNFAFRDAALDLTQFPDYEEIVKDFLPAAMASFQYNGGVYALPDQMSFPVLFYRTDILNSMGLEPPRTWDELLSLVPYLQRSNMEIYLDTNPVITLGAAISIGNSRAVNPVFLSLLYQRGGELYSEDGAVCTLGTEAANTAFRRWTEFYTQHGFPLVTDFVTRFRIGEVPIGIVDLSNYTRLAVAAPEIRGDWGIAPVPGTRNADGEIVYGAPCVTGAAMIIRNTVEKRDTKDAAWTFLKWWTSADTQVKYAREMEALLGPAGRYPVASLEAFETISWPQDVKKVLREILPTLRGIEQVPGGYITGRYVDNAFTKVVTDYVNPVDTLYENVELINDEITKKRQEFGLDTQAGRGSDAP